MLAAVPAVAKTLVFTEFVPGTVAGYVPWRLRRDASAPVTGGEAWAAITVIAIGIAIYLYTTFWGFALIGGGTPAPIAPTKILVVKGLHRFVRNPMYIGVGLVIGGQAWLFHSLHIAIYMACILLTAHLLSSCVRSQPCAGSSEKNTFGIALRCRDGSRT